MKEKVYNATYELLNSVASWLEDPNNEVLELLEDDQKSLAAAAKACVISSAILKKAILDIQLTSGVEFEKTATDDELTVALNRIKDVADSLDESEDETQKKTAAVLDDLLIMLANNTEKKEIQKKEYLDKIENIKNATEKKDDKKEEKKPEYKNHKRILQTPLSTRHCPNCPGVSLARNSEAVYYCGNCQQEFNFDEGYDKLNGDKIPGSSLRNQTDLQSRIPAVFK